MSQIQAEVKEKLEAMEESLREQASENVASLQECQFDELSARDYERLRAEAEAELWQKTLYKHLVKLGVVVRLSQKKQVV